MTEAQSSQADRVARTARVWERRGDFGVVVLSETSAAPLTLAGTAVAVWDALAEPQTVDTLVADLARRFAAPIPVVRTDVVGLLDELSRGGFLEAR